MKNLWHRVARLRWPARISLKAALLLAVVAVVLFPHPGRLVEEVQALRNPEPLIQPDFAGMKEINAEIDRTLKPDATKAEQFKAVERFVYQKIKYQYDWNNWANLDYWPKAEDVWARKREDCDGRAVLAASILRSRGFHEAKVVANLNHAWVMVGPDGLMGPQRETNIRREGGKTVVTIPGWQTWLETLAFVSEFPAGRSMIILFAVLLLAYHPCRSRAGFFGVTTMGLTGFVLLLHWGKLRMDKEITGLGFDFVAAATLLLGALALALLMPRLLARQGGEEPVESTAPEAAPVLAAESATVPAAFPEAS